MKRAIFKHDIFLFTESKDMAHHKKGIIVHLDPLVVNTRLSWQLLKRSRIRKAHHTMKELLEQFTE